MAARRRGVLEQSPGHVLIADEDDSVLSRYASVIGGIPQDAFEDRGAASSWESQGGGVAVATRNAVRVDRVRGGGELLERMAHESVDLVILELGLRPMSGLAILDAVKRKSPSTLVVLTAKEPSVESAVAALRAGAFDYLVKPVSDRELARVVQSALLRRRLGEQRRRTSEELQHERAKVSELKRLVREQLSLENTLGVSPAIQPVYRVLEEVARTDSTVLITGESGTGKSVVARMLHTHSPRSDQPFVEANCVIYSEGVLSSELFGHERGAFTGAARQKKGRFELADGGTIFLDEIGEISPAIQLMLLRFLQEHRFERVGGEQTQEVDVRVIAATNRNLEHAMSTGAFRSDLFYRLNVVPIEIPPLRQRREDIPFLTGCILERCAAQLGRKGTYFTEEALEALTSHSWPGNIRELENVIERSLVLTRGEAIGIGDLPESMRPSPLATSLDESLMSREREHILDVLRRCGGNKKAAARSLGIHRSSLYSKLRRFGIDPVHYN